jgi:UDP-N-acetylglucosamine 2-epimerase (non-hydrolysing)
MSKASNERFRILSVVGTRPNFVKISPLLREMRKVPSIHPVLVHTGQHYDRELNQQYFSDIDLPHPDFELAIREKTNSLQVARMVERLEPLCRQVKPHLLLVVGDVNSTLAASLVGTYLRIPIAHVEAGLRSFDWTMPEEMNRVVTDRLSTLLFTTEKNAETNLLREGVARKRIFFVGNVMIDSLRLQLPRIQQSSILRRLDLQKQQYAVLTLHRPSNVDDQKQLEKLMRTFHELSRKLPLVFPIHPRTRENIKKFHLSAYLANVRAVDSLVYSDFLSLMQNAKLVLTDSGGVQEETTYLRVPCLTVRENTERPVTVHLGTNRVVGTDPTSITRSFAAVLRGNVKRGTVPPLWDGKAAARIVKIALRQYNSSVLS